MSGTRLLNRPAAHYPPGFSGMSGLPASAGFPGASGFSGLPLYGLAGRGRTAGTAGTARLRGGPGSRPSP